MKLYFNPVSSYSQKTLMAFYEKGISFEPQIVDLFSPNAAAEYRKVNPLGKLPFLVLDDRKIPESSIIIEYLDQHHPGPKLIPNDPDQARQVRFRDRFFDFYVNDPMGKIFFDGLRPADKRDPYGVAQAKERLEVAMETIDKDLKSTWAFGDTFTMADCAAAPALNYCRMIHPFEKHKHLSAYYARLAERPSFKRIMKEAEPYMAAMQNKG